MDVPSCISLPWFQTPCCSIQLCHSQDSRQYSGSAKNVCNPARATKTLDGVIENWTLILSIEPSYGVSGCNDKFQGGIGTLGGGAGESIQKAQNYYPQDSEVCRLATIWAQQMQIATIIR